MRRIAKLAILLGLAILLCGCAMPKTQAHQPRLVTKMQIAWKDATLTLTQPEKIEAVLSYLRLLPYKQMSIPDPILLESPGVEITLTYLDGRKRYILQKGANYISRDKGPFGPINGKIGSQLLSVLESLK